MTRLFEKSSDTKPGILSSEFWLTAIFMVGTFILVGLDKIDVKSAIALAGAFGVTSSYVAGRSLVKALSYKAIGG